MVERVVAPLVRSGGVDSVITVSEDPSIAALQAVRLEQFAVGVHSDNNLEAIPADGTGGLGAAIIETEVPLSSIARETALNSSMPGRLSVPV